MVAPTGGDKDTDPPKLLNTIEIVNKETNQLEEIVFAFDEYIVLNKWEENFYISPPIKKRIQKKIKGQSLHLKIEDTLAQNTTYNIAISSCVKDLNEGNILDTLNYTFATSNKIDSLNLKGKLQDAYTLDAIENAWIMLFQNNRNDSVIFKETPNYIAKTNKNGEFNFPNLNSNDYKIVALTNFDFIYNEDEKIAFNNSIINAEKDSFISLLAFNPIVKVDSTSLDTISESKIDSLKTDTLQQTQIGKLELLITNNQPCIIQLLQKDRIVLETSFSQPPFIINNIETGEYQIKYIEDLNRDKSWSTGNWNTKLQPEKVFNYPNKVTIRSNWDLELEWNL